MLKFLFFCFSLPASFRIQLTLTPKLPFPSIYQMTRGNLSSTNDPAPTVITPHSTLSLTDANRSSILQAHPLFYPSNLLKVYRSHTPPMHPFNLLQASSKASER
jgi:hypothetical protein